MLFFLNIFQVAHVLDPNRDPEEHIVSVGLTVLLRSDLLSLGLSEEVEATVKYIFISKMRWKNIKGTHFICFI